jgi:hypothetical protein
LIVPKTIVNKLLPMRFLSVKTCEECKTSLQDKHLHVKNKGVGGLAHTPFSLTKPY